ncbi:hypothetical protein NL529_34210, partial [Klebsiella pneumoniae]|nr:hypothetical protein [Klebsiella pneumoniae]
ADMLSRTERKAENAKTEGVPQTDSIDCDAQISTIFGSAALTAVSRDELRVATESDETLQKVIQLCKEGWPNRWKLTK